MKSKPRVIPNNLAKRSLAVGKIENRITNSHNTVHRITVAKDCFCLRYL